MKSLHRALHLVALAWLAAISPPAPASDISTPAGPGRLNVYQVTETCLRITLKPRDFEPRFPENPALDEREYPAPAISISEIDEPVTQLVGGLTVSISPTPLTVRVTNRAGREIQRLTFDNDGGLSFSLDDCPVLGLGEGGPLPPRGVDWRKLPVEFDRRGRVHHMRPRWQADAYGSRNPVALLVGTRGWGLYIAAPWGELDLTGDDVGRFQPRAAAAEGLAPQTQTNQHENLGKGTPPPAADVPGLLDVFVFDATTPADLMKDVAVISGPAVLPPRWALGYMQSHRTLIDDAQLVDIVSKFREKQIPLDAVIYLGTGFTPRGWNRPQPSFEFNPDVFKRPPAEVIADLHELNVKVALHMVPWDRDQLPTLRGTIPPQSDESPGPGHIAEYWQQHAALVAAGVDAWWPDEGDWFDLHERLKRHQLYYQGPLSTRPGVRPWSLHRNGHLGVARWGGWVWSGDTNSSWKSLEAQIAVGINHSLSLSPFWGSDIGGFYPSRELTGELYARWFQFGAFTPSFRAHGRTWWTRLPWGWGLGELGPLESDTPPSEQQLNNPAIEPIVRRYAELRYQLLSYNYTLAWKARETGLPLMRAMWLHYPDDGAAVAAGDQYLWGRDLLIAPVYQPGATERKLYLPEGVWYDWWTGEKIEGGRTVVRAVDLATMPIYVRAGAILPIDPIRQYTSQPVDKPLTVRIYRGADGKYELYDDDGASLDYLRTGGDVTRMTWNDEQGTLAIRRRPTSGTAKQAATRWRCEILPDGITRDVEFTDGCEVQFGPMESGPH
ncbi:MAG: glycoside hydrolase [Planctomycetaceae bacterium]|nr:glycoside hydrolase [Planctomycetaceae bacterium]